MRALLAAGAAGAGALLLLPGPAWARALLALGLGGALWCAWRGKRAWGLAFLSVGVLAAVASPTGDASAAGLAGGALLAASLWLLLGLLLGADAIPPRARLVALLVAGGLAVPLLLFARLPLAATLLGGSRAEAAVAVVLVALALALLAFGGSLGEGRKANKGDEG